MNKQLTLVPNTISQKQYSTEKAHLFGSRLVLPHIAWVALMMLIIACGSPSQRSSSVASSMIG